ncbi:MAG: hypothetical protein LWW87_00130 [Geobacteraceae bacterium]|nr:hypothetical protein [Geobacteraceae bacterium]
MRCSYAFPSLREEGWIRGIRYLREEAAKRGYELKIQISDNDATRQLAQASQG